jgi:orotate phosphoribosyltransferase
MSKIIDRVASDLHLTECLKFGRFKTKSGVISPYYIDLACLLSSPEQLCDIAEIAAERIRIIMGSDRIDKLASIELKGALIAPSVACKINLPCVIVRKEEKAYGVTGRIVGANVEQGDNILFFDDVVSEGLSKIEGIKPLEELGGIVKHLLVVVNREQGGKENLERLGFRMHALAKISDIVSSLNENKRIPKGQAEQVLNYVKTFQC